MNSIAGWIKASASSDHAHTNKGIHLDKGQNLSPGNGRSEHQPVSSRMMPDQSRGTIGVGADPRSKQ